MLPFIIVIMVVVYGTTNPSSLSHVHAWKQCDQIIQQSSLLKDSLQEHVTTRTIQSRTCTRKYRKTAFVPNQEEEDEEVVVVQQGSLVRPNTSGTPTARTIAGKANTAFILSKLCGGSTPSEDDGHNDCNNDNGNEDEHENDDRNNTGNHDLHPIEEEEEAGSELGSEEEGETISSYLWGSVGNVFEMNINAKDELIHKKDEIDNDHEDQNDGDQNDNEEDEYDENVERTTSDDMDESSKIYDDAR